MLDGKPVSDLTDQEVLELLKSDCPLNAARRKFSAWCGRFDQEAMQHRPIGPVEIRRLEFKAVQEIIAAAGYGDPSS